MKEIRARQAHTHAERRAQAYLATIFVGIGVKDRLIIHELGDGTNLRYQQEENSSQRIGRVIPGQQRRMGDVQHVEFAQASG